MFRLMINNNSLIYRISLFTFIGVFVSLLVASYLLYWSFQQSLQRNFQNHLLANVDILIAATTVDFDGNIIINSNLELLDNMPYYWQIESNGVILKKSPLLQTALPMVANNKNHIQNFQFNDAYGGAVTAIQRTITFPNNKKVHYVFGINSSIAEIFIKDERSQFLKLLFLITAILLFALLVITVVQIKLIIKPLHRIKGSLAEVRSGEVARLPEDFPKEISPLTEEINTLLDYSSDMIDRYRTFCSNLSHSLRTPLTVMSNEAQKSDSTLSKTVQEKSDLMLGIIERNLSRVQVAKTTNILGKTISLNELINRISSSFNKIYQKEISLDLAEGLSVRGDEGDLYEAIGNIIENACKYSKENVSIHADINQGMVTIIVEDDGPGIAKNQYEEVLKRGTRLDEAIPGSGIGLAITKDIIELYKGSISLGKSRKFNGLLVRIVVPAV